MMDATRFKIECTDLKTGAHAVIYASSIEIKWLPITPWLQDRFIINGQAAKAPLPDDVMEVIS